MRWLISFLLALAGLPAGTQAANGNDLRDRLHALGAAACRQVVAGGMQGLAGRDFAAEVARKGVATDDYCACVGRGFEMQTGGTGDEDPVVFMERLLGNTLSACLADVDERWAEADEVFEDLPYDEGDVHMCGLALDDALVVPGFDPAQVQARMRAGGQSRQDLCLCTARHIAAGGEPLQDEIANAANPNVAYASTLAGGIETCLVAPPTAEPGQD